MSAHKFEITGDHAAAVEITDHDLRILAARVG